MAKLPLANVTTIAENGPECKQPGKIFMLLVITITDWCNSEQ
jgi:hypothetical protein